MPRPAKRRHTLLFHPKTLAAIKPQPTRQEYWDTKLPGFGFRVTPAGIRTWCVRYRVDSRLRRLTIGRYPALSLADAREKADTAIHAAAVGTDKATEKRLQRERARETIGTLVDAYVTHLATKNRSWRAVRRILIRDVVPSWGPRPVRSIMRREVLELLERKSTTAPAMARRLAAWVTGLFSFAVEREWTDKSPAIRLKKALRWEKLPSRERVLSPDEIRTLWAVLVAGAGPVVKLNSRGRRQPEPLPPVLRDAFRMLLLSAQRLGEVCRMRWQDVDLAANVWTIPAEHAKNKRPHRLPLSTAMQDLITARQSIAKPGAIYVFSTRKSTSVAGRGKQFAAELSRTLGFAFRAHDLRRTAATNMAEAGVTRDTLSRVLNHRTATGGITEVYDRYDYDDVKRAALEAWARRLDAIVTERPSAKVLDIATGRARRGGPLSRAAAHDMFE